MGEELTKKQIIKMFEPDWDRVCERCEPDIEPKLDRTCEGCECYIEPVVPMSGLCGPCHFGTAEALGGSWWHDTKQELKEGFLMTDDRNLP